MIFITRVQDKIYIIQKVLIRWSSLIFSIKNSYRCQHYIKSSIMITRLLTRIPRAWNARPPALSFQPAYDVSARKLLNITSRLNEMDSLQLDKLFEQVLQGYRFEEKKKKRKINQEKAGNVELIRFLYDCVSEAQVGFLKGDMHAELVFKLNKYLKEKPAKLLNEQMDSLQFKKVLNMVTEIKSYRLPKKQIKQTVLEDKKNMYERQVILEIVSNEQAHDKCQNILDSLIKVGKVHLTDAFKKCLLQWFSPLCNAIKEQQAKCKDERNIQGKRKIYAYTFSKLAPEKLTLLCLSELLKQITAILYKDYAKQFAAEESEWQDQQQKQPQFEEFDCIRQNSLCLNLAKWVSIQECYEEKEKNFKMAMREYDALYKIKKNEKIEMLKKAAEEKNKTKSVPSSESENQKASNNKNEAQSNINDFVNEVLQNNEAKQQQSAVPEMQQKNQKKIIFDEKIKQIQQRYNQKFVPVQDRKTYLQDVMNKMLKQFYKFKSNVSEEEQYEIGCVLIYLMRQILQTENKTGHKVPLLTLEYKYIKKMGEVICDRRLKINEFFLRSILPVIEKQGDLFMHLDQSVPTMIEPLPWVDYEIGGYYVHPSNMMRFAHCRVQERLIKYSDTTRVCNVLNFLGRTPWKINKRVLEVVEGIWEEGGSAGQIPKRYTELITPYLIKLKNETHYKMQKQLKKTIQQLRDEHSLRASFSFKLTIARSFGKLDRFFFPHNLDFRGRVYPIPPHLNHIGDDLSRGLLLFADGKRLGESGVRWLKIHCANLMGKDKAQLDQKVEYIHANLRLVHAIAENPFVNRQWLQYEDCWQALGAIMELSTVLKQPHPQQYVSCLHVHQDGSCNGLQHYAALGKDTEGAYQVNLGPTQRPGDVYTHVAKMVIKLVQNDAANSQHPNHELAKKLLGNIKRKTIKQTVMTSVYGVTFIGAREQILKQIKDQAFLKDDDEQYKASTYLAAYTLDSISNLFLNANLIKKWLISCAKIIASHNNPVGWITPMGLPVAQPYRKETSLDTVNTIVQSLKMARQEQNLPINKSKQQSAFPPNFVHSLDSTHMMFTAERCEKLGVTFAAVHDSYWTHAGTIEIMNKVLREEFIRLHSMPLLENLKRSFEARYPTVEFPEIPKKGDFDLSLIKQSKYFFS